MKTYFLSCLVLLISCGQEHNSNLDFSYQPTVIGGQYVSGTSERAERVSVVGLEACTGVILAEDLVLTAAHCRESLGYFDKIYFGNSLDSPRATRLIHSSWIQASTNSAEDFAIVKFKGGLPEGYRPVKLVSKQLIDSLNLSQTPLTVAGYGKTQDGKYNRLKKARLSFVSRKDSRIETSDKIGGNLACSGDSGGPLFADHQGESYLVGITSRSFVAQNDPDKKCIKGNIFSDVGSNLDTIQEVASLMSDFKESQTDFVYKSQEETIRFFAHKTKGISQSKAARLALAHVASKNLSLEDKQEFSLSASESLSFGVRKDLNLVEYFELFISDDTIFIEKYSWKPITENEPNILAQESYSFERKDLNSINEAEIIIGAQGTQLTLIAKAKDQFELRFN